MTQWQPIETAPRDGTRVDLWIAPRGLGFGPRRITDCWNSMGIWWRDDELNTDNDCRSQVHDATHWQPLPEAPQ